MVRKLNVKKKGGIYTIGHSNHRIDTFIALLKKVGIKLLVDVRSRPYSRYNPTFNRDILKDNLKSAGIDYKWAGEQLGGLNGPSIKSTAFIDKMDKVVDISKKSKISLMCSEGDPAKCHRAYKLSSWIHRNTGKAVKHITPAGIINSQELEDSLLDSWIWFEYGGKAT